MMQYIINLIQSFNIGSFAIIILSLVILVLLYIFRKAPIIIKVILEAMSWVENEQNTKKGKEKRAMAIKIIKGKLPKALRFLITDSLLITIIELILNTGANIFGISKKIDIIGNESQISAEINKNIAKISYESIPEFQDEIDADTRLYAELEASTDFHGNEDMSVKIGFEKKF